MITAELGGCAQLVILCRCTSHLCGGNMWCAACDEAVERAAIQRPEHATSQVLRPCSSTHAGQRAALHATLKSAARTNTVLLWRLLCCARLKTAYARTRSTCECVCWAFTGSCGVRGSLCYVEHLTSNLITDCRSHTPKRSVCCTASHEPSDCIAARVAQRR